MFRTTLRLDERADVAREVAALRANAEGAGLDSATVHLLTTTFAGVLGTLVESGSKLKAQGSQLAVTRKFEDRAYSVTLHFGAGGRESFFDKVWRLLRGR